jgi:hypothetical protein
MMSVMNRTDDWQRLAACVRDRRSDLGLTQEETAAAGGPSTATLRLIENGRQGGYRPAILRALERALQWERGSVRAILDGGDPAPADDDATLPGIPPVAAPDPDPMAVRIGQAIADELTRIAAGIQAEVDAARRAGVPDREIFTDPFERNLWLTELTSEHQRVLAVAALRSVRPRRPPNSGNPPIELAG